MLGRRSIPMLPEPMTGNLLILGFLKQGLDLLYHFLLLAGDLGANTAF